MNKDLYSASICFTIIIIEMSFLGPAYVIFRRTSFCTCIHMFTQRKDYIVSDFIHVISILPYALHFQHAWPRTPTERLMSDMQGTAAKFLAILEALSETHRRTLHCEAPAPDTEDTAIDVCAELFFAGMEIVAGGGGSKQSHVVKNKGVIHPSVMELHNTSLMELVAKGT